MSKFSLIHDKRNLFFSTCILIGLHRKQASNTSKIHLIDRATNLFEVDSSYFIFKNSFSYPSHFNENYFCEFEKKKLFFIFFAPKDFNCPWRVHIFYGCCYTLIMSGSLTVCQLPRPENDNPKQPQDSPLDDGPPI